MFKRINYFTDKHNILYNKQFEFRSKHSTLYMQYCQLLTKYKELLRMVTTLVAFAWTYLRHLIQSITACFYKNVNTMELEV